jgi:hypothetical protein
MMLMRVSFLEAVRLHIQLYKIFQILVFLVFLLILIKKFVTALWEWKGVEKCKKRIWKTLKKSETCYDVIRMGSEVDPCGRKTVTI